jgi:dihydrofolate reductase
MKLIQIVAVDDELGIGKDSDIPWKNKEDMQHFKTSTKGHSILMGRGTWESLPLRPLPHRFNVVLSSTMDSDGVCEVYKSQGYYIFNDKQTLMDNLHSATGGIMECEVFGALDIVTDVFVIGGATIYDLFLEESDEIWMSRISGTFECDTFYPARFLELFELFDTTQHDTFKLEKYRKK